jgi:glycosyltransferase involved in cell wall biosynthesis
MRIAIIGSRGIPARYGGFETLAERLSGYLSGRGHQVTVYGEQDTFDHDLLRARKTLFSKRRFPVLFYLESVLRTLRGYDTVLILGVGAGLFLWLYKLAGTRFVTHVDGMEQVREKFTPLKRMFVRFSQRATSLFVHDLVADAETVADWWAKRFELPRSRMHVIRYGTDIRADENFPVPDGLEKHGYYLLIARIVPENNIRMIIEGFLYSGSRRKAVIIGNWNDSEYGRELKRLFGAQVTMMDPIYDRDTVAAYRSSCYAYLHGHSVGGTNPTLVEALGSGSVTLCHDNPYNRETTDGTGRFFRDAVDLSERIREIESLPDRSLEAERTISLTVARSRYDWTAVGNTFEELLATAGNR